MRGLVACVCWCAIALAPATRAQAQAPPPGAQPPAPQPPPAPWYRLTLDDGRVVDVQIVGGDAAHHHVVMNGATYSLPRAKVVGSVALHPAPAPAASPPPVPPPQAYSPPPPPPPPPPVAVPIDEREDSLRRHGRAAGVAYFALGYLVTMPIALARQDNDSSAKLGLIPVVGPLAWALDNDDNDPFEDGWDWLAAFDTLIQGTGVYLILAGGSDARKPQTVRLVPMSGRQHGFAIGGSF